jgi:predicted dehydrogenase
METPVLRVGVIGAGIGATHLAAYAQLPRVEIVALAGLDDDRVKRVAAEYNIPRTYREYQDLLAAPDIDAVSVCLPNALHAPVSIEAMRAGKHVLVEKPLARNSEEAAEMAKVAEETGKILMVSFDKRYRGDVQWIKEYIDSGALGKIYYAKAHWMRRQGIPRLGSWFVSKEMAGGGPLIDLGVHVLDIAMYLMGEPRATAVSANTYAEFGPRGQKGWVRERFTNEDSPYEVEDLATAFIRLENGGTLLLETSWATHSAAADDFGVTLYGTEGGVELFVHNYGYDNTVRAFADINGEPVDISPRLPKGKGHLHVIERFVNSVLDGAPVSPNVYEGKNRVDLITACYASAKAGREVEVQGQTNL